MTRSNNHLPVRRGSGAASSKVEREIKLTIDPNFRLPSLPDTPPYRDVC